MLERLGITFDGLWGGRALYTVSTGKTYTLVQYDADPRDLGRMAAPDAPGKRLDFSFSSQVELRFVIPSPNPALNQVLAACEIQPWSPQSPQANSLSSQFADQAILAVQAIGKLRFQPNQATPEPKEAENLSAYAVTVAEFGAEFEIGENFFDVSESETGIPLRRTRCVAALVAMFKTRAFNWPQACAYVDKEAPQ